MTRLQAVSAAFRYVHLRFGVIATVTTLWSCDSGPVVVADRDDGPSEGRGEVDISANPALGYSAAPLPMLRLDLRPIAGAIEVGQAKVVVVRPQVPFLSGDRIAVSYVGSQVVDARVFRFPKALHVEGVDATGRRASTVVAVEPGPVTVWMNAEPMPERVDVLDAGGSVLTTILADQFLRHKSGSALTERDVESEFPWISFSLGLGIFSISWDGFTDEAGSQHVITREKCGETILEIIRDGLRLAGPATRQALSSVGCCHRGTGGDLREIAITRGSDMFVNLDVVPSMEREDAVASIVHEAMHAYVDLVDDTGPAAWLSALVSEAAERARAIRDQHQLELGLSQAWSSLHESAVPRFAGAYRDLGWHTISDEQAVASGFATNYGSKNAHEDMAELVAMMQVQHGRSAVLQSYLDHLPRDLNEHSVMLYTKMLLLKQIGAVSEQNFARLAGSFRVSSQSENGLILSTVMGERFSFTQEIGAGWIEQDGGHFFSFKGKDAASAALLRVLDPMDRPRGLHRLGQQGSSVLIAPNDLFNEALVADQGLVFITSAVVGRVEGILLAVRLRNNLGSPLFVPTGSFRAVPRQ